MNNILSIVCLLPPQPPNIYPAPHPWSLFLLFLGCSITSHLFIQPSFFHFRTDVSKYLVTKRDASGKHTTVPAWELTEYPFDDMVTFYIGCSFTFDNALIDAGIPIYHVLKSKNVAMYNANIKCNPVGPFSCDKMVVSMRLVKKDDIEKAVAITAKYHDVHGAPIHIGDPRMIGIEDVLRPDAGDEPECNEDEVPVFWGCGVTTSVAIKTAS